MPLCTASEGAFVEWVVEPVLAMPVPVVQEKRLHSCAWSFSRVPMSPFVILLCGTCC